MTYNDLINKYKLDYYKINGDFVLFYKHKPISILYGNLSLNHKCMNLEQYYIDKMIAIDLKTDELLKLVK